MIIALDYDKTYTASPKLWDAFIDLCTNNGHRVVCITMRYPEEAIKIKNETQCVDIYYTSRKAKKPWAEAMGIPVAIWIDDNPGWLFEDAL